MKATLRALAVVAATLAATGAARADGYCWHCYPCQIPPYNAFGYPMPRNTNAFAGNGPTFNNGPIEPWNGFRPDLQPKGSCGIPYSPYMRSPRDFFMVGH